MPIYSYQCDNCGLRFERTQKFTDPPVTVCPECRKKRVRKLLTSPGIVFKGSGWYSTDHRSPSGARGHAKHTEDKPAETKSSEKSESSSTSAASKPSSES
jgi:putative FmdB family regulatory protein